MLDLERRNTDRLDCTLPCVVLEKTLDETWKEHRAQVTNLSVGGCFLTSLRRPGRGSEIALRIGSSPAQEIRLFGEVRHARENGPGGPGFGFQIVTSTEAMRERLDNTLNALDVGLVPTPSLTNISLADS